MGFDLYGIKPESDIPKPDEPDFGNDKEGTKAYFAWQNNTPGAYFRNNVWYWRPLWEFISDNCSDIISQKDVQRGTSNDAHRISKTKAKRIAARIRRLDKEGRLELKALQHTLHIKNLPQEECHLCYGTGTREGMEGWQSREQWLHHHKSLERIPEKDYEGVLLNVSWEWANELNGCNSCKGSGKVDDFQSHYPFEVDNVREFGEFCDKSGGFEIC